MDKNLYIRNEKLAQKVIKGLESRNMTGYYAANKEEALQKALELIPEGSTVTMGGCMSANEIGLTDAVKTGNYNYLDRAAMDPREALLVGYDADVFLTSANAMTEDGIMVNVCDDIDGAMKRARAVAAPTNAQRFEINTPCKKTGSCANCKSPDTICCQFLITRYSRHADRIHVILVNDSLGF